MIELQYKDFKIELFNDSTYDVRSTDNINSYSKEYFSAGEYFNSLHGTRIFKNGEEVESCIVIGSGGVTGIHERSSLIDGDSLFICCGDSVFCLKLPDLSLQWNVKADMATCFQVLKLKGKYLVHGEISISYLDKDGNIIWEFGGADIFVLPEGGNEVVIKGDYIEVLDWNGTKYILDFDGKLMRPGLDTLM